MVGGLFVHIKITDPEMNRLIFSKSDAANLIKKAIDKCESGDGGFVCSYKMKSVNMLELAKVISNKTEIVGLRPGEKLNETLINIREIPYTYIQDNMIYLYNKKNLNNNKLNIEYSSLTAEKMSLEEIKKLIWT